MRSVLNAATTVVATWLALANAAAAAGAGSGAGGKGVTARAAFETLKSLAGVWQGTAGANAEPATVVYRIASGGTVVVETQFPDTSHEMITVYHPDGDDLVATHYCSQGNQPRFRLDRTASSSQRLIFSFAGGSNLDPAKDGHVHGGEIVLTGGDGLRAQWEFWSGGSMQVALPFELRRQR